MPQRTVTVHNAHLKVDETYAGVAVSDLLAKQGVTADGAGAKQVYHSYVKAEGTDGYWVLYSASDMEGAVHKGEVIVALTVDRKPLGGGWEVQAGVDGGAEAGAVGAEFDGAGVCDGGVMQKLTRLVMLLSTVGALGQAPDPLSRYASCKLVGGPDVVETAPLGTGVRSRTVDTLKGPRSIAMEEGKRSCLLIRVKSFTPM